MSEDRDHLEITFRDRVFRLSWARAIFLLGLALFGLLVIETAVIWIVAPDLVWPILRGVAAEVTAGREGGIPVFLEGGVPPLLTIQYSLTQDLTTSFLVYPLFLYLLDRYAERDNFVMRRVRKMEETAKRHERKVRRYGPVFLFFFMLLPFMVNGPLVGLMIGRLARVPMRTLLFLVPAATLLPAIAWTLFYDTLFAWAESVVPGGPQYITIGVLALIVVLIVAGFVREKMKDARDEKDDDGARAKRHKTE